MKVFVAVDHTDLRAVQAAFKRLPKEASKSLRERTQELASVLADRMQASGRADSRQSAAAATSVRARKDRVPTIVAGGAKRVAASGARAHELLYGSEFGARFRFGWYAALRFASSTARQFRPHRGAASYWLFASFEDNRDEFFQMWKKVAHDVEREWSKGGGVT